MRQSRMARVYKETKLGKQSVSVIQQMNKKRSIEVKIPSFSACMKETLVKVEQLTDKHRLAQQILKMQFPHVGGLQSTLLSHADRWFRTTPARGYPDPSPPWPLGNLEWYCRKDCCIWQQIFMGKFIPHFMDYKLAGRMKKEIHPPCLLMCHTYKNKEDFWTMVFLLLLLQSI